MYFFKKKFRRKCLGNFKIIELQTIKNTSLWTSIRWKTNLKPLQMIKNVQKLPLDFFWKAFYNPFDRGCNWGSGLQALMCGYEEFYTMVMILIIRIVLEQGITRLSLSQWRTTSILQNHQYFAESPVYIAYKQLIIHISWCTPLRQHKNRVKQLLISLFSKNYISWMMFAKLFAGIYFCEWRLKISWFSRKKKWINKNLF